jgi:non-ribosomal peptide synthetase component F
MLAHQGIVNYSAWHIRRTELTQDDRVSHLASVTFDASMCEVWPTFSVGGTLVQVMDERVRLTPALFAEWATKVELTLTFLPTVLAEAFLSEQYPPEMKLRVVMTGGDKIHRGPREEAKFKFFSIYGPTECTIAITCCQVCFTRFRFYRPL